MKKLLAFFSILLSALLVQASDTPRHMPFHHRHQPALASHYHMMYGHSMQHGLRLFHQPVRTPLYVSITVPDLKAGDAEMESNSQLDMTMISMPSFDRADREMNPMADLRISVGADYVSADTEMEVNSQLDLVGISVPGFLAADAEISVLADKSLTASGF